MNNSKNGAENLGFNQDQNPSEDRTRFRDESPKSKTELKVYGQRTPPVDYGVNSQVRARGAGHDIALNMVSYGSDPSERQLREKGFHSRTSESFSQSNIIPVPDEKPFGNEDPGKGEDDDSGYGLLNILISKLDDEGALSKNINNFRERHNLVEYFKKAFPIVLLLGYLGYFIAVVQIHSEIQDDMFWCSGDGLLYVITGVVGFLLVYFQVIKKYFGKELYEKLVLPLDRICSKLMSKWYVKLIVLILVLGLVVAFYVIDTENQRRRLVSFCGLFFVIFVGYVFSFAPAKVVWRFTVWGLSLQFILALLVLRWPLGSDILNCLSNKVTAFLNFSLEGADFVFGAVANENLAIFAFTVLPVTIFFSFCTNILYYFGAIQWLVLKLGWVFKITIGSTLCESMNAAASIFLGLTESPLLIKPYLPKMTNSEIHTIMTAGFATVAGSVLAAYISMGADPALLLTASVMNAPAALAISKLLYPNLQETRIDEKAIRAIKSNEVNALHAGCVGVTNSIPLVANIGANLIAFISFVAFFNAIFDWGCQLVDFEEGTCSLEGVFGYIFMPLAWMMGVEWVDCYNVGQLLGIKVIINEFVAYEHLSEFASEGAISDRSIALATFALCGFGNISSIGIMMGGLGPMAPERRDDMAKIVFRAMIAGCLATYSSACIAGTLLDVSDEYHAQNSTLIMTVSTEMSSLSIESSTSMLTI